MANNHFSAQIYGHNNGLDALPINYNSVGGIYKSFPSAGTLISVPTPGVTPLTAGYPTAVTINSVIEVLPSGLNVKSEVYYSDSAAATLGTAAV